MCIRRASRGEFMVLAEPRMGLTSLLVATRTTQKQVCSRTTRAREDASSSWKACSPTHVLFGASTVRSSAFDYAVVIMHARGPYVCGTTAVLGVKLSCRRGIDRRIVAILDCTSRDDVRGSFGYACHGLCWNRAETHPLKYSFVISYHECIVVGLSLQSQLHM